MTDEAPKLIQHPTLPDWLFNEYESNDGNTKWLNRDGYRHDMPQEEPLFTVKGIATQKTSVSQQFVMYARKWDRDNGKKHIHNRKKKVA